MRRLWALALALALLAGCAPTAADGDKTHILCTTYPVYLFTTAVTDGADNVEVALLIDQPVACLHDYTLTVNDMKAVERADVIVMNGAGLEEFLGDALGQKDVPIVDCSRAVHRLPSLEQHQHDDEEDEPHEVDPHIWMDPEQALAMLEAIRDGLGALDLDWAALYTANCAAAGAALAELDLAAPRFPSPPDFITFHDGFQYFAHAFGLDLLRSIEEEEGAEASAKELEELVELVRERDIPAIFVEKNGSRRSADVIARETGCKVYELDMIMSGQGTGMRPYLDAMERNLATVKEALK